MNKSYLIPNWPAPACVRAFSTTRLGGHSKAPYDSFNLGYGSNDGAAAVEHNRLKLKRELALPSEPLWLHQIHGPHVIDADHYENNCKADGSYTATTNRICIIGTADCMPILLCDKNGQEIAAVHAGWRGLAGGVIETALAKFASPKSEILAWLGPAIGPTVYEVGDEVRQQFIAIDAAAQAGFKPTANNKWLADLYTLAKQRLHHAGVINIYGGDFCTFSDSQRFFSHRRDQGKTGRMASLIWLAKD